MKLMVSVITGVVVCVSVVVAYPIADPGNDQVVHPGELVRLNGNASWDTDGYRITSWHWVQESGAVVELMREHTRLAEFLAPAIPGVLRFSLTVGSAGSSSVQHGEWNTLHVFVEDSASEFWLHALPVVQAARERTVEPGIVCSLTGKAWCDDSLNFGWQQLGGPQALWWSVNPLIPVSAFQSTNHRGVIVARMYAISAFGGLTTHADFVVAVTDSIRLRSLRRSWGRTGDVVKIRADGLGAPYEDNEVWFGSTRAPVLGFLPISNPYSSTLQVLVPHGLRQGTHVPVMIRVKDHRSNALEFWVR